MWSGVIALTIIYCSWACNALRLIGYTIVVRKLPRTGILHPVVCGVWVWVVWGCGVVWCGVVCVCVCAHAMVSINKQWQLQFALQMLK